MPSVSHGGAVNGITDAALQIIRSTAGMAVGARPASSLTLPLVLGWRGNMDSMMEATTSVVVKYSAFLWEGRVPLARL